MLRKKTVLMIFLMMLSLTGCLADPYKDGVEALESGQYEEASEQFRESVEKEKNLADSYRGLGIALWETEDYEGARDAFQSAAEAGTEKNGTLYNFLGSCELRLGNAEQALEYFGEGLKDESAGEELVQEMRFNTIVAYEALGDIETAKSLIEEYTADYPGDEAAAKEAEFLGTR